MDSVVDHPVIKLNWFSEIDIFLLTLISTILSRIFIMQLNSLIPLQLLQFWISLLFSYRKIIILHLHSSGMLEVLKMTLNSLVSHSKPTLPELFQKSIGISSSPVALLYSSYAQPPQSPQPLYACNIQNHDGSQSALISLVQCSCPLSHSRVYGSMFVSLHQYFVFHNKIKKNYISSIFSKNIFKREIMKKNMPIFTFKINI